MATAGFTSEPCSRTESSETSGTTTSSTASTSSAAAHQRRKAVMLKGPSLTSKTYFVPLPDTLDRLVARATELFPIPPGKVPHITLGTDERAIILQDSYEFIRDRELLHFRWSAETPRRNLGNRVRWDPPPGSASVTPFNLNASGPPQGSSTEGPLPSSTASTTEVLKSQLQASPTLKRDLTSTTRANTIANRDPNTQFGEGVAARKAHAQRVLAEQQRKREEEHTADALGVAPLIADVEHDTAVDADPEATAKAVLELATTTCTLDALPTASPSDHTKEARLEASMEDVEMSTAGAGTAQMEADITSLVPNMTPSPSEAAASAILLAPAAVTITMESPPRKKIVDNGGLETPPSSGSRSSSPFHSSERALSSTHPLDRLMGAQMGDEPSSSPISSPTRGVSSRYGDTLAPVPIAELDQEPCTSPAEPEEQKQEHHHEQLKEGNSRLDQASASDPSVTTIDSVARDTQASGQAHVGTEALIDLPFSCQDLTPTPTSAVPKSCTNSANDRELNRIYSFLSNLVAQLLSHKANWAFQRPMSVEFEQFSARSSRPVDLFTIRDSLVSRKYGSQHLEGRMAANAVVTDFEDDLALLYANARRFFGVRSTQAECVEHLEKFSRSFLNEWKRTQGSASQTSDAAAAVKLGVYRSPGSRSEKRVSPFAMLMTPNAAATHNSALDLSSGKKTHPALPSSMGLMRRPDFAFKRNTSYEGPLSTAVTKRAAQSTTTTSEAFERALRASTATPQPDRIRPRQEVIAPFVTRSVIETDFMARPPPQQQQPPPPQAEVATLPATAELCTPARGAGMKRKLSETASGAATGTRSPSASVSPPPSPSPTKRTRPAVAVAQKSSKSATRRNNKKKAKQAAAAAAAAAAAVELTEKKRGKKHTPAEVDLEEQCVLELLQEDVSAPKPKRARTTNVVDANEPAAPQDEVVKGKDTGKGKKGKISPSTQRTEAGLEVNSALVAASATSNSTNRTLRSRRTSETTVPPPKTPPRSTRRGNQGVEADAKADMRIEVDGFEVTGSRRRSARQRKPVHLD